jgi:hypothetical protein
VEKYTPLHTEARKSNNVTPVDFVKDQLLPKYVPLIGGAIAGWFLGGLISRGHASAGREIGRQAGSLIGTITMGYLLWKRKREAELNSADVFATMKEVLPMAKTDEDLRKDNTIVNEMIDHEQKNNVWLKSLVEKGSRAIEPQNMAAPAAPETMAR